MPTLTWHTCTPCHRAPLDALTLTDGVVTCNHTAGELPAPHAAQRLVARQPRLEYVLCCTAAAIAGIAASALIVP